MNEEHAREIAIRILDEFEDLLDEHNITIPSQDRTGRPEEACLYGEEYRQLEDAITDILVERPSGSALADDVRDAGHPIRSLAIRICDEFEELLARHDIKIPSRNQTGDPEEGCLFGSEYYALEDAVVGILMEELGVTATRQRATAINEDARAAVGGMQTAMGAAAKGFARIGPAKVRARKALVRLEPRGGTTAPSR